MTVRPGWFFGGGFSQTPLWLTHQYEKYRSECLLLLKSTFQGIYEPLLEPPFTESWIRPSIHSTGWHFCQYYYNLTGSPVLLQRSALAVAANCCQNVSDFHAVSDAIPVLSARLQNQVGFGEFRTKTVLQQNYSNEHFQKKLRTQSVMEKAFSLFTAPRLL